jgi:serine/threonine-protein kinase RsbW
MTNSQVSREVEFFSLPENINLIEIFVEQLKDEFSLSVELEANMLVALSEAVNNAIFHGNAADPAKRVHLHMEKNNNSFLFIIEDEGNGFTPEEIRDPTAPENLDKPTGRGIFLIRNLADQVTFDNGGKKVVITFIQH